MCTAPESRASIRTGERIGGVDRLHAIAQPIQPVAHGWGGR
jgi:hypothetical protein